MEIFRDPVFQSNVVSTILVVIGVVVLRMLATKAILRGAKSKESKLEWKSHIKSISHVFVFVGILIVWGSELKTFAISLLALAVALVIATNGKFQDSCRIELRCIPCT